MTEIKAVWLFLSVDPTDGDEGVMAVTKNGFVMPLVASDEQRLKQLIPIAQNIATTMGCLIRLARFDQRTDIEKITPGGKNGDEKQKETSRAH